MRQFSIAGLGVGALLLLAGCGIFDGVQSMEVDAGFTPTALGFEVDEEGSVEIAAHSIVFRTQAGSLGGTVTGYEAAYYHANGEPMIAGDSRLVSRGSLAHEVPPGVVCAETQPCTMNASDASFVAQSSEPVENVITLPGTVALEHLGLSTTGAYAIVTFHARTSTDVELTFDNEVAVTYPVSP